MLPDSKTLGFQSSIHGLLVVPPTVVDGVLEDHTLLLQASLKRRLF
jgi:hypothetical protein